MRNYEKPLSIKTIFKTKSKKLKIDLSGLAKKNEEISFSLEKAKSESTLFKNYKYSLQREHDRLKEKLGEFEELQRKYQELSKVLDKNKKEYDLLRITHEICEQNRRELNLKCEKDLNSYRVELARIEEGNEVLQKENFTLKSKINTLDGEIFQLQEKISSHHNEKRNSDEIKYNLLRKNEDLSNKLERDQSNLREQEEENKQLSAEICDLKIKIQKSETTISSYVKMNDELKIANEELNKFIWTKDRAISDLNVKVDVAKMKNEALHLEVKKLLESTKELEGIKINLKQRERIITEIEDETETLKDAKQNLDEENFLLKEMCENYKYKLEDNEIQVRKLEDLLVEKDNLLKDNELKIIELQKMISDKFGNRSKGNEEFEEVTRKLVESFEQQIYCLTSENKTLKDQVDDNLINRVKELTAENEILRKECKRFLIEDKVKMIEETNKSFSDALQKMYAADKNLSEGEEDFTEYCQREIEKYKIENEKFKNDIASCLEEKKSIVDPAKFEGKNITTKDANSICERCKSDSKLIPKRTNFDKLMIRKEKLEQKIHILEEQVLIQKETKVKAIEEKSLLENELKLVRNENVKLTSKLEDFENQIEVLNKKVAMEEERKEIYKKEEKDDLMNNVENHKEKLQDLVLRLEEEENTKIVIFERLHQLKESLTKKRFKLERNTANIVACFKVPHGFLRKISTSDTIPFPMCENLLLINEEISITGKQIDITSNVLDYMLTRKAGTIFHAVGCQTENSDVQKREQRRKSTLTLRPSISTPKQQLGIICDHDEDTCRCSGDASFSKEIEQVEENREHNEELKNQDGASGIPNQEFTERATNQVIKIKTKEDDMKIQPQHIDCLNIPRSSFRIKKMVTRCLFVWIIFIAISCLFLLSLFDWDGDSALYLRIPWSWTNFIESPILFVGKEYINGPPPT